MNPPHRVKSISMTSFSAEDVEFILCRGNNVSVFRYPVVAAYLITMMMMLNFEISEHESVSIYKRCNNFGTLTSIIYVW